ncbi:hypothetical protein C0J52_00610 [Blattella germanica]|nr:hypothetical protein C0J52_00610 [Blattella germanica]
MKTRPHHSLSRLCVFLLSQPIKKQYHEMRNIFCARSLWREVRTDSQPILLVKVDFMATITFCCNIFFYHGSSFEATTTDVKIC